MLLFLRWGQLDAGNLVEARRHAKGGGNLQPTHDQSTCKNCIAMHTCTRAAGLYWQASTTHARQYSQAQPTATAAHDSQARCRSPQNQLQITHMYSSSQTATHRRPWPQDATTHRTQSAACIQPHGNQAPLLHCYIYARSTMSGVQLRNQAPLPAMAQQCSARM